MANRSLGTTILALLQLAGFGEVGALMAHRDFRLYLTGHSFNLLGLWIYRVAVGWLTWELTHSGTWLGIIVAADALPSILLGPLGGAFADRMDRRRLALATQWVMLAIGIVLTVLTLVGLIEIIGLFVLTLARGINVAFWQPVRLTLIPSLVPRRFVGTAIAVNSTTFNLAFFIGPAIAGPVILFGGAGVAFAVDTVSSTSLLLALLVMRLPEQPDLSRRHRGLLAEVAEGMRFAFGHPGIGPLLLLSLAAGLGLRPAGELLAGFADRVFAGGPGTLSALTAALGFGALGGAVLLARLGGRPGAVTHVLVAGVVGAVATLAFVASAQLAVALASLVVVGFALSVLGISNQTLIQYAVPDNMRGRVLSLSGMIMRGAPALGALAIGAASEVIGLRAAVAIGAVFGLAVFGHTCVHRKRLSAALQGSPSAPVAAAPGED